MIIRKAHSEDIEILADLAKQSWLLHADNEPHYINKHFIDSVDAVGYVKEILTDTASVIYVAEENGGVVGYIKADIKQLEDFFVERVAVYIDEIYIMEEYRQQGIAKKLIRKVEILANEKGIKILKTRIYTFNEVTKSLIEKNNFNELYTEYFKIINNE